MGKGIVMETFKNIALSFGAVILLYWVLSAIALWRIFAKAHRPRWWSLIPVLRIYLLYSIAWETKIFWYVVILAGAVITVNMAQPDMAATYALLMSLAAVVMLCMLPFRLAKAFGKSVFFGIGLLLLSPVFLLILGFDGSAYCLGTTGSGRRLGK